MSGDLLASLRSEKDVLCDPKANLVRRLEALYALKTEAFKVHPRVCDLDRARAPAAALESYANHEHHHFSTPVHVHSPEHLANAAAAAASPEKEQDQDTISKAAAASASGGSAAAAANNANNNNNNNASHQQQEHQHGANAQVAGNCMPCQSPASVGIHNLTTGSPVAHATSEEKIVDYVVEAYQDAVDTTDSVLLQHELLYNLGQLGARKSIAICIKVLKDYKNYHEVSRHEAIEAIGAIGCPDQSIPALKAAMESLPPEALTKPITESAELAFRRLELVKQFGHPHVLREHSHRDFCSVDPAPSNGVKDLKELRAVLLDPSADMFLRYQAMFALRNLNSPKSVEVLCEGLVHDKSSCLFRHEVAFVLGQMEYESSVPALTHALRNEEEHGMVRHEAAEALGAIGTQQTLELLKTYVAHEDKLVSDSCYAALQLMDDSPEVVNVKYGGTHQG